MRPDNWMKIRFLLLLFLLPVGRALAQLPPDTSRTPPAPALVITGFVDAYYVYDFNLPADHERPGFLYNHKRHNEVNVNLALVRAAYTGDDTRAALGLMAGTYPQYNLAHEQRLLQNIFEANVGVKVADRLWLDVGIFGSHIGFESAISKENWTLTRSLLAENSPYYLAGAKLSYAASGQWTFTGLVVNGWQNIRETPGNSNKAIGTKVQFEPSDRVLFNSSTFIGNEQPDYDRQMRYFHNFYTVLKPTDRLGFTVGFDYGLQKRRAAPGYSRWYSPVVIVRYLLLPYLALAGRAEHYNDQEGVIVSIPTSERFSTSGYSLGLDYAPAKNILLRVEGRLLRAEEDLYRRKGVPTNHNGSLATSIAVSF